MAESAKIMISVPVDFLAAIDRVAKEEHRTRSELLREAARQYMEARRLALRPIDRPEVRAAIATMDKLAAETRPDPGWDSVKVIRRDRDRDRPRKRRA